MVDKLKRLLESRFRISTQLYLAMGGAVLLTLAASLVAWFSFNQVGEVQSNVNEGSVPELAAAFGVAQYRRHPGGGGSQPHRCRHYGGVRPGRS